MQRVCASLEGGGDSTPAAPYILVWCAFGTPFFILCTFGTLHALSLSLFRLSAAAFGFRHIATFPRVMSCIFKIVQYFCRYPRCSLAVAFEILCKITLFPSDSKIKDRSVFTRYYLTKIISTGIAIFTDIIFAPLSFIPDFVSLLVLSDPSEIFSNSILFFRVL